MQTPIMRKYNVRINNLRIPDCAPYKFLSDEYWACQAKHYTLTIYHPVGTAKMGPDSDYDSVVDPRLHVRGVRNLRVVDASIMPHLVTGISNRNLFNFATTCFNKHLKENENISINQSKLKQTKILALFCNRFSKRP